MIERVDIIITTKNRLEDLIVTIEHMLSIGFKQNQFYIIDDASTDGTFDCVRNKFPLCNIRKNASSRGLMTNRSDMMGWSKNDYVLSIDDDSYIRTREDVEEAIAFLNEDTSFGIFHFRVFNQIEPPPNKILLPHNRHFLRGYIGCGHIIKRDLIDKLGRYREVLVFYCEELDYSLRAYKAGYKTITQDNLIVHHRIDMRQRELQKTTIDSKGVYGREWRNIHLYSNNIIITMLYYPIIIDLFFTLYRILLAFKNMVLKEGQFVGFFKMLSRVISFVPYCISNSSKLTYKQFWKWFSYSDMTDGKSQLK